MRILMVCVYCGFVCDVCVLWLFPWSTSVCACTLGVFPSDAHARVRVCVSVRAVGSVDTGVC